MTSISKGIWANRAHGEVPKEELARMEMVWPSAREAITDLDATLGEDAAKAANLVTAFAQQVIAVHDPDVVQTFLRWRDDPVIDTLLNLATGLDEHDLDELIVLAESLHAERQPTGLG